MLSNLQLYLEKIKDLSLVELVQSQNYTILSQLFKIYDNDELKLNKINSVDKEGYSPLHKACARGIPEIVELLLTNGANSTLKSSGGETAVHLASRRGSPIILNILKNYNADFQELDNKGQSAVHHAVFSDSLLVLLWLETSTDISLISKDKSGITPLHLSCILGKTNCIKFFLRKSFCNVLEKTQNLENCLHLLIKHRHLNSIPLILFRDSSKTKICCVEHDWKPEESTILKAKDMLGKTPIDLFYELPENFRFQNRIFSFLFHMLSFSSLKQTEFNFLIFRFILFLLPSLLFLIGVWLSTFTFPNYRTVIFPVVSLVCLGIVRVQSHRMSSLDLNQNPIYAGSFISGIVHDLLCLKINIYSKVDSNWEFIVFGLIFPIFVICYLRLIFVDSGKLTLSEIDTRNFSDFLCVEMSKQKHSHNNNNNNCSTETFCPTVVRFEKFCQICETAPRVERVKHCKLCNVCMVNMDHHCLFLMKCIARNNMRNFIFLIFFCLILIFLFIELSVKVIISSCGPLSGSSPLPYAYCGYTKQTWICAGLMFNVPSFIWGFFMLYNQLLWISYNSTYYYCTKGSRNSQNTKLLRIYRIFYFMLRGKYYLSSEDRQTLSNI